MTPLPVYYVDGYHGGLKGHMPYGCWSDIAHVFQHNPEWKISIEVEPGSWAYIQEHDPLTFRILQQLFTSQNSGRIEFVTGSYAQPYCWCIDGESNIRQLQRGIAMNHQYFPDVPIDTYAVQEPCWTSSLPQILRSLGFVRSTLKNPATAWAGYSSGIDHDVVQWVGPDGSSIPCVPRYACEDLSGAWATECERMEPAFISKCEERGLTIPVGSQLQDLGWPAGLNLGKGYAQYVIWREYFSSIATNPQADWHVTQEDILCTLPWGERRLQRLARQVRQSENRILLTEKLSVLNRLLTGSEYPAPDLAAAWDHLMMAQHHDAWICVPSREDRSNWGWFGGAHTWSCDEQCDRITAAALKTLTHMDTDGTSVPGIRVFNMSGHARISRVSIQLPMAEGYQTLTLQDSEGCPVPCQIQTDRISDDGQINAVTVSFHASVPAFGYQTYQVLYGNLTVSNHSSSQLPADHSNAKGPCETALDGSSSWLQPDMAGHADPAICTIQCDGDILHLQTDLYEIDIDLQHGGTISRLYHKNLQQDFTRADPSCRLNEYRGYFPDLGREVSSAESPAEAEIVAAGPLSLSVVLSGQIAGNPIKTTLSLAAGQAVVDFSVRADWQGVQWIGNPCTVSPENQEGERIRSHHDSFMNCHAMFPYQPRAGQLYKNAAYDVCCSRHDSTRFFGWDEIKHNIILHWIDVHDPVTGTGLAIFSDHTTSYGHGENMPLHLTFAWGGDGGFWWGKCPLKGHQEMRYAILPHAGNWQEAGVSQASRAWNEPMPVRLISGWSRKPQQSLLSLSDRHVELSAACFHEGQLIVRLFNASADPCTCTLTVAIPLEHAARIELDGRLISHHITGNGPDGSTHIQLSLPPFSIRTMALDPAVTVQA